MTEWLHFHFSLSHIGEGNGNPLQCSCLENPMDGEPGGLPSMELHRVRHDWRDSAAATAVFFSSSVDGMTLKLMDSSKWILFTGQGAISSWKPFSNSWLREGIKAFCLLPPALGANCCHDSPCYNNYLWIMGENSGSRTKLPELVLAPFFTSESWSVRWGQ